MKNRLKEIRTELKLTQVQMGDATGKNRDIISNYEQGRVVPDDTFIMLLHEKYGYNPEWIRTGEGEKKVQSPYWEKGAALAARAMQGDVAKAREYLAEFFSGWSDEEVLMVYELLRRHYPRQTEEKD